MAEEIKSGPQIVVAFQNYAPPFDAEKAIRRMLRVVSPKFMAGLHSIVLTNVAALSRNERECKTWGRRRVALKETRGYYSQEWSGEPARITILVDNFDKSLSRRWRHWPFFRNLELSELFFHELGHHIHRVHRPKYEGRENVADKWSKKLSGKYVRDRYWYLFPVAVPFALIVGLAGDITRLYRKIRR